MLARRSFLKDVLVGATALGAANSAGNGALAKIEFEDTPLDADTLREDCSFVQGVRDELLQDIANGLSPDTRRSALCPLCGDRIVVSAAGPQTDVSARR